jgi:FemAB-related protein (PEP-CTERM system-associated)
VKLRVERFCGAAERWDAFARAAPGATHCHLSGWRRVIEEAFGHECIYLAATDETGGLAGVLPLVRVRSALFGHFLVSMPFLNYGGPLGSTDAVRALAARAVELARESGARLLEMRSRRELPIDLPASHRKITVVLDLPAGNPDTVWNVFRAKLRSQIRRPQREGVEVRFGPDQLDAFFAVFSHHMRDLGTPTMPKRFFDAVTRAFSDDAWMGVAYLKDRPVACGCGFAFGGEFEMTWASALMAYNAIAPNMLVYWSFIERAAKSGLTRFNFGRCTPGGSTHRFKQQWGSSDEQLWWYQHSEGGPAKTPSPDDSAYSWGPRLWRRLPLSVATWLGPRIVKFIP